LLAAATLHFVGIPVAKAIAPDRFAPRKLLVSPVLGAQEVEVDVDLLQQVTPSERRTRVVDPSLPADVRPAAVPRLADSSHVPRLSPTSEPEVDPFAVDPVATAAAGQDTDFAMPPPSDFSAPPPALGRTGMPGLGEPGNPGVWAWPGVMPSGPDNADEAAPTRAPARQFDEDQGTKAMKRAMRHKDKTLGIDRPWAASIASVIVAAVRASDTPHESRGSFSVRLGASGAVEGVSLIASTGGPASIWQGVAASAAGQLKGRSYALSSNYAKGAVVVVTAVSAVKMPGGGTSRSGATVSFDVSDVGARPMRVVSRSISVHAIE